jgi:hypothetical protein
MEPHMLVLPMLFQTLLLPEVNGLHRREVRVWFKKFMPSWTA